VANIFVIDDDEQLLRMVGLMLKRGGHRTTLISNPSQGLAEIEVDPPDLLVCDVMMPGMSGHDVTRHLRANKETAHIPILILTARAQDIDRQTALESGADEYLSKPVVAQELLSSVEDLLGRGRQQNSGNKGFVISVFGLRGGVGRTTLAVNLAGALRRVSQKEVCLVDFSPSGGQVAMHFRLSADKHWGMWEGENMPALHDTLLSHRSGIHILAAPDLPVISCDLSAMQAQNVIDQLRQNMTFTILDLPPILSPAVMTALAESSMVLHTVNPDLVSVQIGGRTNRTLTEADVPIQQKVHLLNYATSEIQLPVNAVERGLNSRIAFTIEHDPNQAKAMAQGLPLSLTNNQSPLPVMVKRMAGAIWGRVAKKN
jgi:pilus assembly protein CpaE